MKSVSDEKKKKTSVETCGTDLDVKKGFAIFNRTIMYNCFHTHTQMPCYQYREWNGIYIVYSKRVSARQKQRELYYFSPGQKGGAEGDSRWLCGWMVKTRVTEHYSRGYVAYTRIKRVHSARDYLLWWSLISIINILYCLWLVILCVCATLSR